MLFTVRTSHACLQQPEKHFCVHSVNFTCVLAGA